MLKAALDSLAIRIALIIIVTVLGLAGAGFLLASLYLWLAGLASTPLAAFLTGLTALLVTTIALLVLWLLARRGEGRGISRSHGQAAAAGASDVTALAGVLGAEMGSWVGNNAGTAVAGALLSGVVLGASPSARSELRGFLKAMSAGRAEP